MALPNIWKRQRFVSKLLLNGYNDSIIKELACKKFECSVSCIHADLIYLRNYNPGSPTYHLSKKVRLQIYERDGYRCGYCYIENLSIRYVIDHIVPAAIGGKSISENLVACCFNCNTLKRRQIWIPRNFMEISKGNTEFRDLVLANAVKDFR